MKVPADSTSSESPTFGLHKAAFSGDLHTVQGGGRSLLFLLMRALVQSQGSIFRRSLSLIASQRPHFNMKTITLESMASTHDFRGDTNILSIARKPASRQSEMGIPRGGSSMNEEAEVWNDMEDAVHPEQFGVLKRSKLSLLHHTQNPFFKQIARGNPADKTDTIRPVGDTSPQKGLMGHVSQGLRLHREAKGGGWWCWRQALE